MNLLLYILLMISILFGALGQIFMKLTMNSIGSFPFLNKEQWINYLFSIAFSKYMWLVFIFYAISILLWLIVLSYADLSLVRPLMSFGYVITLWYGIIAGENVTYERIIGTLLIIAGVIFLTKQ